MKRDELLKQRLLLNLEELQKRIKNNDFKGVQSYSYNYVGSDYKRLAIQVRKDLIELENYLKYVSN